MVKISIKILALVSLFLVSFQSEVYAQLGTGSQPAKLQDLEIVFGNIAGFLLPAAGILFFVMFVFGGFKYLTSGGDLAAVAAAHKTLTYAIGGLIVVAIAFLVLVVINELTGAEILDFTIYQPS